MAKLFSIAHESLCVLISFHAKWLSVWDDISSPLIFHDHAEWGSSAAAVHFWLSWTNQIEPFVNPSQVFPSYVNLIVEMWDEQWCTSKYLATSLLKRRKFMWFAAFTHFHGINTSTMVSFKLSMWCQWDGNIPENLTMSSRELVQTGSIIHYSWGRGWCKTVVDDQANACFLFLQLCAIWLYRCPILEIPLLPGPIPFYGLEEVIEPSLWGVVLMSWSLDVLWWGTCLRAW